MRGLRGFVKRHNMELQFWGYEGGNVLATIAGAGGFGAFAGKVDAVLQDGQMSLLQKVQALAVHYPDAFVTIALGALVVLAPLVRRAAESRGTRAINLVDLGGTMLALAILGYAIRHDTSWITVSASSFVVASSFLRQCKQNPFLMKAGGLALALGGAALAAFGFDGLVGAGGGMQLALGLLTAGTGLYVIGASLLTYQGGIYETAAYRDPGRTASSGGWFVALIHPIKGIVARTFTRTLDRPIAWINRHLVNPAIFWASEKTKERKPFATSMWARLPWRLAAGGAAFASGTPQGIAFGLANIGWAIGDVSIGSLDWREDDARS